MEGAHTFTPRDPCWNLDLLLIVLLLIVSVALGKLFAVLCLHNCIHKTGKRFAMSGISYVTEYLGTRSGCVL